MNAQQLAAVVAHFDFTEVQLSRLFAAWDESKHPRRAKGDERGGEFAPSISGVGEMGGGGISKEGHDTIAAAFEAGKPDIAREYDRWVRSVFESMKSDLGPNLKGVHNNWTWARTFSNLISRNVSSTGTGHGIFDRIYSIDEAKIAKNSISYANDAVRDSIAKATGKLPGVTNVKAEYRGRNTYFVSGMIGGKSVTLEQTMIINRSSKGTLFNQWPARISVDGKLVSESKFKKGEYEESEEAWDFEWDESKHPRHGKGSERGGEFAPKAGSEAATGDDEIDEAFARKGKYGTDGHPYDVWEEMSIAPIIRAQRAYERANGIDGMRYDHIHGEDGIPWSDERIKEDLKFQKVYEPVFSQGKEYKLKDEPPKIPLMFPKHCYENALKVVSRNPDRFSYAEGIVLGPGLPIMIEHSWVVDRKDGRVIDPTIGYVRGARYFGFEYSLSELRKQHKREGTFSMHFNGDGIFKAPNTLIERKKAA